MRVFTASKASRRSASARCANANASAHRRSASARAARSPANATMIFTAADARIRFTCRIVQPNISLIALTVYPRAERSATTHDESSEPKSHSLSRPAITCSVNISSGLKSLTRILLCRREDLPHGRVQIHLTGQLHLLRRVQAEELRPAVDDLHDHLHRF